MLKGNETVMNNFSPFELLQISYKKLKATVYFDKTQLVLRNKIVEYEEMSVKRYLSKMIWGEIQLLLMLSLHVRMKINP